MRALVILMMTVFIISIFKSVGSVTSDEQQSVTQYLTRLGYPANRNLSQSIRMFQRMSGLEETGVLDDVVYQQTLVSRCGGLDVTHDHNDPDHHNEVLRYHVQQYPDPDTSLSHLSREEIDEVILAAARIWTDPEDGRPRLERSEAVDEAEVVIVFCPLAQCLPGHREEEIARPALGAGARRTVYLDTQQAWASEDTLATLSYGAAFNVHIQLLQV